MEQLVRRNYVYERSLFVSVAVLLIYDDRFERSYEAIGIYSYSRTIRSVEKHRRKKFTGGADISGSFADRARIPVFAALFRKRDYRW